jgi:signal peptidase I
MAKRGTRRSTKRTARRAVVLCLLLSVPAGCDGPWRSGDRVLVNKCLYEVGAETPRRFDVVVFKYPEGPFEKGSPKNYIKRLLGLPGEILAILFGQLFFFEAPPAGSPPHYDDLKDLTPAQTEILSKRLWIKRPRSEGPDKMHENWLLSAQEREILGNFDYEKADFTHTNDASSLRWFAEGRFKAIRKTPPLMLAMRRIVYDNDHQAADLLNNIEPRWTHKKSAWLPDDSHGFAHAGSPEGFDWLYYQHLPVLRHEPLTKPITEEPKAICDYMDYNVDFPGNNWVGDLMLECRLTVDEPQGEFAMVVSRGDHQYQARWNLASGECTLLQRAKTESGKDGDWQILDNKPTGVNKKGEFSLRFANFDSRLTVWVNRALPFGDGHDYPPPELPAAGEMAKNLSFDDLKERLKKRCSSGEWDLQEPAKIGSKGAKVKVHGLQLWRDTYYTLLTGGPGAAPDVILTMYVQPGHYLCLGDNSPQSSDGRSWGLVPQRLMLGRALLVYFPFDRAGPIR